jgi:hypothetical protein
MKEKDQLCIYVSAVGVVASAELVSGATRMSSPFSRGLRSFPFAVRIQKPKYCFETPVTVNSALRCQLDAFAGKDPNGKWALFVRGTRLVTEHDFLLLTSPVRTPA